MSIEFDHEQLEAITGGDAEFEREILEEFLSSAPQDMAKLQQGVGSGDAAAVGAAAHALKGAAATIGGKSFAAAALDLEHAGKQGTMSEAPAMLTRLTTEYEGLRVFLQQRVSRAA